MLSNFIKFSQISGEGNYLGNFYQILSHFIKFYQISGEGNYLGNFYQVL